MSPTMTSCPHAPTTVASPQTDGCAGCGSTFNLRLCAACGYVGCCESQQAHNRRHFDETGHPIIKSLPVGEGSFTWCWECAAYLRA